MKNSELIKSNPSEVQRYSAEGSISVVENAWQSSRRVKQKVYRRSGKVSDRFPNIQLQTHDDRTVSFYDDLIKNKAVVIDFLWVGSADKNNEKLNLLKQIHRQLAARMGRDMLMLSISIDGDLDSPEAMRRFVRKNGLSHLGWFFLTGDENDIESLRYSLGVYDPDPEIDTNMEKHSRIITFGNDRTNQWAYLPITSNTKKISSTISNVTGDLQKGSRLSSFTNRLLRRFVRPVEASKSYRYLARQVALDLVHLSGGKSIVFSSATGMDAKSEVLLMFSHFLQEELVSSVLIIDATLRGTGLTRFLKHGDQPGLVDMLVGGTGVEQIDSIIRPLKANVSFLPVGNVSKHHLPHISENQAQELIEGLKNEFEYVVLQQDHIMDDTRYLPFAKSVDLVLVHLEERSTPTAKFEEARDLFVDHQISNVKYILSEP